MGQRVGMLRQPRRVPFSFSWPFVLLLSMSLYLSCSLFLQLPFARVSRPLPSFHPSNPTSLSLCLFFPLTLEFRLPRPIFSRTSDECLRRNAKLVTSNRQDPRKRLRDAIARGFKRVAPVTLRRANTRGMAFKVHAMLRCIDLVT